MPWQNVRLMFRSRHLSLRDSDVSLHRERPRWPVAAPADAPGTARLSRSNHDVGVWERGRADGGNGGFG